jgi:hypothetical protein
MSALGAGSPLTVPVPCRGEAHHLRCENGQLLAPDHSDVDGELTLTALGGESTPCAELVSAWRSAAGDLRVLTLTERSAADRLERPPVEVLFASSGQQGVGMPGTFGTQSFAPHPAIFPSGMVRQGWGRTRRAVPAVGFGGAMASATPVKPDPLVRLLAISSALTQRLAAEVIATWSARIAREDMPTSAAPALSAALAGRAKAALSEWAGLPYDAVAVEMVDPGMTPTVDNSDKLRATLPFAWLGEVWLPGLSQLFGRFTLAAREHDGTLTLDTIDTSMHRRDITVEFA